MIETLDLAEIYYTNAGGLQPVEKIGQDEVTELWGAQKTQLYLMHGTDCLVDEMGAPIISAAGKAGLLPSDIETAVILGMSDDSAVFAVDVSKLNSKRAAKLAGGATAVNVRSLVGTLGKQQAERLAYASDMMEFNNRQYHDQCGDKMTRLYGGQVHSCEGCQELIFPRVDPSVLMLVELPGDEPRIVLGKHANSDSFSLLAGHVTLGWNLERTVKKEIAEEIGVGVNEDTIRYIGSQSLPGGRLMIVFCATASTDSIEVDGEEIVEARGFTRAEVPQLFPDGAYDHHDSIGRLVVNMWLARAA